MCYFYFFGKNPKSAAFLWEKEQWLQLHHIKHVWYRSPSLYGSGMGLRNTLCIHPVLFMFSSIWRLIFCYAWLRGLCLHSVLPMAWASLSSTVLCISGSLELVPWYCNNIHLNSVLFEVRNVITSLLGLVIVSHLSPKGSGRFMMSLRIPK
jgi:hypothetical protein